MNNKISLLDDSLIPLIGQGTWGMGENKLTKDKEVEALKYGIEKGMTLIDTAEMYGSGGAEIVVGEAIKGHKREDLYIVSKVYPHNAGEDNIFDACRASLERLGTDYLDMYLLHWRGMTPLSETVECMESLVKQGKIRRWGVSNFDAADMEELWSVKGGENCVLNQVLYHLGSRGIEYDLIPALESKGIPVMAYCPLAQAGRLRSGLLSNESVKQVARKHKISPAQVLLAFVLKRDNMIAIPKAVSKNHIDENVQVLKVKLDMEDMQLLGKSYPSPTSKMPLDIV